MNSQLIGISNRYRELESAVKVRCLLAAAFNLTIEYRGLRDRSDNDVRRQGFALNEIQHKLLSQATAQLGHQDRYPDDVFFQILSDLAESGDVQQNLVPAFSTALSQLKIEQ